MDLVKIVEESQRNFDSVKDATILLSLAKFEQYVDEAYQGRLFFELIQNARDAAFEIKSSSRIKIKVSEDKVLIANTGKPFDEMGVQAMTRLGLSNKSDNELIGHKGIGFKAIQEFSKKITIITEFGSIYFSRSELAEKLKEKFPGGFKKINQIPMFYYPYYDARKNTDLEHELEDGVFDTVIEFTLDNGKTRNDIINLYKNITDEELVLLGSISGIDFESDTYRHRRYFEPLSQDIFEVKSNGRSKKFRIFQTGKTTTLPDSVYDLLEEKEKELFEQDRRIDIKLVFELNHNNELIRKPDSKLFLFYPLDHVTGFPYIIHSYFSCNPERTSIRSTKLNDYLFEQIAVMQTETVLSFLKANLPASRLIEFLVFERKDPKLGVLYDLYTAKLKTKDFIWLDKESRYGGIEEIILCSRETYLQFKDHKIKDRYLFYLNESTHNFLKDILKVPVVNKQDLFDEIENICEAEKSNPLFFNSFYQYCLKRDYDLGHKKILLGHNGELYLKQDDVFYVGKSQIKIPELISNKLILLHSSIRIAAEDLIKCTKLLGIKKFETYDIVEKALDLFDDSDISKITILVFLKNLKDLTDLTKALISQKIQVPVLGSSEWLRPLKNPVYLDSEDMKYLYPNGSFIDIESCTATDEPWEEWKIFFLMYGVWEIPALFLADSTQADDASRVRLINGQTNKNAPGYLIFYDRMLDFPENPNYFFYKCIVENWANYCDMMRSYGLKFMVKSYYATYTDKPQNFVHLTSFAYLLKTRAWIFLSEDQQEPLHVNEVFGLNRIDSIVEKHLMSNLKVWVVDYNAEKSLIDTLGVKHFNAGSVYHIIALLKKISEIFESSDGKLLDNEFKRFYHTVLKYLYNIYNYSKIESNRELLLRELKQVRVLCREIIGDEELIRWKFPEQICHIDERMTFDLLPLRAKESLKFYFTKTDKTEIGKIFSRVGRILSKEVTAKINYSEPLNEYVFIEQLDNLPYIIAATEDKIDEHLDPAVFGKIKNMRLIIHKNLEKEISLLSDESFKEQLPLKFHYDISENEVHIAEGHYPCSKNLLGEILNYVFSAFVSRDLEKGRLFRDLLYHRSSQQFKDSLQDFEFDKERLADIKSIFSEAEFSSEQVFWNAVLSAKGISESDNNICLEEGRVDFTLLACLLDSGQDKINSWHTGFDYSKFNASENLEIIRDIVKSENIFLDALNVKLSEPISFEYLYKQQYDRFKNKHSNTIKFILHKYYSDKDIPAQKQFNTVIHQFEKLEPLQWESVKLDFDAEKDLIGNLNVKFQDLNLQPALFEAADEMSWKAILKDIDNRKKTLKRALKKADHNTAFFDSFIQADSNYSLLYFEQYKTLTDLYSQMYPVAQPGNAQAGLKQAVQFEMAETDEKGIVSCSVTNDSYESNSSAFDEAIKKINKNKGGGGWGGSPAYLPDGDHIKHIGREGERLLFLKYCSIYGEDKVSWVSENAASMGFVPDKEAVGYDMRYVDENNETHYIEVKTSTHEEPEFHISINEIRSARKHRNHYHVMWITNLFNVHKREYFDLHNMFMEFDENEDFFHNSKFHPQLTGFKILFKPQAIKPLAVIRDFKILQ